MIFLRCPFDTHSPASQPSLIAQLVKNLPALQETWVQSLGWEDLLEKGKATHSRILTWVITWTEEPGRLQSIGSQRVRYYQMTFTFKILERQELKRCEKRQYSFS